MNILFLTLRTFRDSGGIQRVCRSMCKTLAEHEDQLMNLCVLSLYDFSSDLDERYLPQNKFKGFSNDKPGFIRHALRHGLTADILLLSHVNLVSLAMLIKVIRPGIKIVLICHGVEIWRPLSLIKRLFLQRFLTLWCVSNYTAAEVKKQHAVISSKVHVIHNGLDPYFEIPEVLAKPAHLLKKYGLKENTKVLFCLSRMTKNDQDKGYVQLITLLPTLLKENPGICYLLAGQADAHEQERIKNYIQLHQLGHQVKLLGYLPEEELVNHYLLADLFVLCSKKEGFGMVLIEAAACGCALICGNDDGSRDAVLHGKLAKMIDTTSKDELLSAIRFSLNRQNPQLKLERQKLCLEHFSYKHHCENVKRLLTLEEQL